MLNVSRILRLFSEQSKLKILLLLYYNGSLPVCVISRALGLDQTLVSHHLKTLKASGLDELIKTIHFSYVLVYLLIWGYFLEPFMTLIRYRIPPERIKEDSAIIDITKGFIQYMRNSESIPVL